MTESVKTSEDAIFDDIRPCRDEEVRDELQKIINDDMLVNGILKLRFPKLKTWFGPILRIVVRAYIKKQVKNIKTIADFQMQVAATVKSMIATTTDGATFTGFDKLDPNKGYLFISNHRDISLDPAFIDYALHTQNLDTVRIAIGDNLLKMPGATALMRLNKSFIVKRSPGTMREKLKELCHLSEYMGLSLKEGNSIWIAQREGRAKDGYDATEEAVLKMISMQGRAESEDFATYMSKLNIIPVSITYEIDPGDCDKAHELEVKANNNGAYKKNPLEDIKSIIKGIKGYKGRVSVVAGDVIDGGFSTPAELAAILDKFIYENYVLYPSALISAEKLGLLPEEYKDKLAAISPEERQKFEDRIKAYPTELHNRIYSMYAATVVNHAKATRGEIEAKDAQSA